MKTRWQTYPTSPQADRLLSHYLEKCANREKFGLGCILPRNCLRNTVFSPALSLKVIDFLILDGKSANFSVVGGTGRLLWRLM